jgi:nucleotide-binding universal stress UspA family protein
MEKQTILVPTDFTHIAGYALEHAVKVAKTVDNDVTLLHIVKDQSEVEPAEKKIHQSADEAFTKYFTKPHCVVRVGSIFTTIGEVADEVNASLVIMGTHGIKGMQRLTGSWALKVIVSTKVPFVIVQDSPTSGKFEKVVFPIDFRREDKEKNQWVSYLAKHYNSKFYLIKKEVKDRLFKAKVASNLAFTKKFLDSKEVHYEIHTAKGKKKFAEETVHFARDIHADLILVMTTRDITLADYVLGAEEQKIIANSAKIPVMCVNPRVDLRIGGFSAMGG